MAKSFVKKNDLKCPKCNSKTPHALPINGLTGNAKREGGFIYRVLKDANYPNKTDVSKHPFSVQFHQKRLQVQNQFYRFNQKRQQFRWIWGCSAQAHHLICCEALDSAFWIKMCYTYNYNVNCVENAVILPATLAIACQYRVPLHRGPHSATTDVMSVKYTIAVGRLLKSIKRLNKKKCSPTKTKEIIDEFNRISREIWEYLKIFYWTLTVQGANYHPNSPVGCRNTETIGQLRKSNENCKGRFHHLTPKNMIKGQIFLERL